MRFGLIENANNRASRRKRMNIKISAARKYSDQISRSAGRAYIRTINFQVLIKFDCLEKGLISSLFVASYATRIVIYGRGVQI